MKTLLPLGFIVLLTTSSVFSDSSGSSGSSSSSKESSSESKEKSKDNKYGTIIGIDLGTSKFLKYSSKYSIIIIIFLAYSCVGVYKNGRVEVIANDQGNFNIL